jgi:pimeloyl-ACP methyl ester carboxylesterase
MRRVVLCLPAGAPLVDPAPEETAARDVELAFAWGGSESGVVGWGEGGMAALELAGAQPDLVDRLVLVSTPVPDSVGFELPTVNAKTLLLYGSRDGGNARAAWWKDMLGGRIEMIPGEGDDILATVWPRVLSHLAPRTRRK